MFQQKLNRTIYSVLFLALSILAGCAGKKKNIATLKPVHPNLELHEMAARMTNIPEAPFGFKVLRVINDATNSNSSQVQYALSHRAAVDIESLKQSYQADMELLGWNCISEFRVDHILMLLFERPSGVICQVSLDESKILTVTILNTKKGL